MRDLEHVERTARPLRDAVSEKVGIDLLLNVAGEQHRSLSVVQLQDDRDVVDGRAAISRAQRHLAPNGPIDVQRNVVQP